MKPRIEQLRALVQLDPADETAAFLLGLELAGDEQYEEACHAFEEALRRKSDYSAAYRQLGNCLERLGQFEEAVATYQKGSHIADGSGDLQAGKEMRAFLKRLARDRGIEPEEND